MRACSVGNMEPIEEWRNNQGNENLWSHLSVSLPTLTSLVLPPAGIVEIVSSGCEGPKPKNENDGRTDGQTDRRTDGRTDGRKD